MISSCVIGRLSMLSVHFRRSAGTFEISSHGLALLTLLSTTTGTLELPEKQNTLPHACSLSPLMQCFFLQTNPFDTSGILLLSLLSPEPVDLLRRLLFPKKKIFLFQRFLLFSDSYQQHKLQLLPSWGSTLSVVTGKPKPGPHL